MIFDKDHFDDLHHIPKQRFHDSLYEYLTGWYRGRGVEPPSRGQFEADMERIHKQADKLREEK